MPILPINANPMIRAYTHHLFLHSILGNEEVLNNLNASIDIINNDISKYEYSINDDHAYFNVNWNKVDLYSKEYAPKEESFYYRDCNQNDELIIKVEYQQMVRNWGIIYLFVQSKANLFTNNDFIYNANIRFGKFCKDTLLIDDGFTKQFLISEIKQTPYWLKLSINDGYIISSISFDGYNWIEKHQSDFINQNKDLHIIGVCFDLQANDYFDWVFSNHIQLYLYLNPVGITLDYLITPYKNYSPYTFNPFINFIPMKRKYIDEKYESIFEFIKENINEQKYIELILDELYLPSREAYQSYHYNHANLIYGYDTEYIYLIGIVNGKPCMSANTIDDVIRAYEESKTGQVDEVVYVFDRVRGTYTFDKDFFKQNLRSYLKGKAENIQLYNLSACMEDYKSLMYGINIYDGLMTPIGLNRIKNDLRIAYTLYEHKKCMIERIQFLLTRGYLNNESYNSIIHYATMMCKQSHILLNIIMKSKIKENGSVPLASSVI